MYKIKLTEPPVGKNSDRIGALNNGKSFDAQKNNPGRAQSFDWNAHWNSEKVGYTKLTEPSVGENS